MKCSVCKESLRANAIFCDTCGNKITKQDVASTIALSRSQLKAHQTNPAPASNTNAWVLLSGAALVIVGAWLGATFLSAEPASVPRESNEAPRQIPVVLQTPTPLPTTLATPAPPKQEEPQTTPPTDPDSTLNPFKKKEPVRAVKSSSTDPFGSPSDNTAGDSVLNPFTKKNADSPGRTLTTNPDGTLKPRFGATP